MPADVPPPDDPADPPPVAGAPPISGGATQGAAPDAVTSSPDVTPNEASSDVPTPDDAEATATAATDGDQGDEGPHERASWLTLRLWGIVGAVIGFVLALTPSLLPRPWLFEGLVAGFGALIGYGIGVLVAWAVRRISRWRLPARAMHVAWWVVAVAAPLAVVVGLIAARSWQNQVRVLVDEAPNPDGHYLGIAAVTLVVFCLGLLVSRGVRALTRFITKQVGRVVPLGFGRLIGVIVVAALGYWVVTGFAFDAFVRWADSVYVKENAGTPADASQPETPLRSGGPGSLVSWDSLGYQGRAFVGRGPTKDEIATFDDSPAQEPIRVYVGLDSAPDAHARAELAVKELERTGAFDRRVLVVAAATGTGWLEPQSVDSIEYLWHGDTAIASMQYSYLPSWISFLVDKERAAQAGQELFDAVFAHWESLPANHRPKLIAYGLSLGSFAGQSAFATPGDITARTDGAVFAGSPDFSQPWGLIEDGRDPGSPQWQPVYRGGRSVRFAATPDDFAKPAGAWDEPRVAYLQHANDPVVWWSPSLILRRPDWLTEPPGPGRSPQMHWIPVVTFLQVTVDQFFGTSVPEGQGHNYGSAMVGAWQAVVPAAGWDATSLARLEHLIDGYAIE